MKLSIAVALALAFSLPASPSRADELTDRIQQTKDNNDKNDRAMRERNESLANRSGIGIIDPNRARGGSAAVAPTDTTDATLHMIEQITKDTPVRRAALPLVSIWTPKKGPCPSLGDEVLPALLAKPDACGIAGQSGYQKRLFFVITTEDYSFNQKLAEAYEYLGTPAGARSILYTAPSTEGIMRNIRELFEADRSDREAANASQPDFSKVRELDEQIRKQAAKASSVSSGSSLAYFFLPASFAPNRSAENAKLQSLILQRVIERDAAIRQHAAEHPGLYAEKSTP